MKSFFGFGPRGAAWSHVLGPVALFRASLEGPAVLDGLAGDADGESVLGYLALRFRRHAEPSFRDEAMGLGGHETPRDPRGCGRLAEGGALFEDELARADRPHPDGFTRRLPSLSSPLPEGVRLYATRKALALIVPGPLSDSAAADIRAEARSRFGAPALAASGDVRAMAAAFLA